MGRRRVLTARLGGGLTALLVTVATTATECASVEDADTIHSCSPSYIDENELGRLAVQQPGPRTTVAWGVYPKLPAARYVVSVYAGARKVDGKDQDYAPHGSLSQNRYSAGDIFKIQGKTHDMEGGVVQKFFIRCRLV